MFVDITEEIMEEFSSYQPEEWSIAQLRDPSPELEAVRLQEEVDPQHWQAHIQLCKPLSNVNSYCPLTCERQIASVRRWKNAYGEGTYTVHTSVSASSWGDDDYEEMVHTPFDVPNTPIPPKPRKELPQWRDRMMEEEKPAAEPVTLPAVTIAEAREPEAPIAKQTVRVQLTLNRKGKYVKGSSTEVDVDPGATASQVVAALRTLDITFPKAARPDFVVRVQIQNLVNGSMSGGGDYRCHNTTVQRVAQEARWLLEAAGLYRPGAAPTIAGLPKTQGNATCRRPKSEEGSHKPATSLSNLGGGGGLLQQESKIGNDRANPDLMAELQRMLEG